MKISIEVTDRFEDYITIRTDVRHADMIKSKMDTYPTKVFESMYSTLMTHTLKEFEAGFRKTIVSEE